MYAEGSDWGCVSERRVPVVPVEEQPVDPLQLVLPQDVPAVILLGLLQLLP